mmetsp:Transcript_13267/g.36432  ORF Transcript_13267/g.36432 Transcript_13267/m.36432 type:complete len:207 (-) Transcript_13267:673-1293(-)
MGHARARRLLDIVAKALSQAAPLRARGPAVPSIPVVHPAEARELLEDNVPHELVVLDGHVVGLQLVVVEVLRGPVLPLLELVTVPVCGDVVLRGGNLLPGGHLLLRLGRHRRDPLVNVHGVPSDETVQVAVELVEDGLLQRQASVGVLLEHPEAPRPLLEERPPLLGVLAPELLHLPDGVGLEDLVELVEVIAEQLVAIRVEGRHV